MDKGIMRIRGLAYEDVVAILLNNGYEVKITVEPQGNINETYFVIEYEEFIDE